MGKGVEVVWNTRRLNPVPINASDLQLENPKKLRRGKLPDNPIVDTLFASRFFIFNSSTRLRHILGHKSV